MKVISVVSRKGGVGKTATAGALGAGLQKRGYIVLYIDLDSQYNLSSGLAASTTGYSSMDLLTGTADLQQVIQHTPHGDIIAGSEDLAGADASITGNGKEYRLRNALEEVKSIYDYVIIDTPAALGVLTVNALTAATQALIPVQADIDSLLGLVQLKKAVDAVKQYCNKKLTIAGILITRYSGRAIISRDMQYNLEEAAQQLDTKLYSTPIRECIAMKEAKAQQADIFSYAPRSNAAKDYDSFINEFLQEG